MAGVYQYDEAGNVIYDGRSFYLYDPGGRLCGVNNGVGFTWQYVYDASGNRVAKGKISNWPSQPSSGTYTCYAPITTTTPPNVFTLENQYLVDGGGDQVTELDGSGNWQHSNAWQGGRLTGTYDQYGLYFAIADPLGTRRVQATAGGIPELNCFTLPWGNNSVNTAQHKSTAIARIGCRTRELGRNN